MGNSPSRPVEQHVFYGETPVQFSHNLLNALEQSSETDSSRNKSSSLHIASLVTSELERLQSREDSILAQISFTSGASVPDESTEALSLSRHHLQQKLDDLKTKLSALPMPGEEREDQQVRDARDKVVGCLRRNDRRPLDCWGEIEGFRTVARRREREFVGAVVG